MIKTKYLVMISFISITIISLSIPNVRGIDAFAYDIADEDAYVRDNSPDSNYGSYYSLYAGIYSCCTDYVDAYLHFTFDNRPTDYTKAEISLDVSGVYETINLTVCIIQTYWNEYTITWNNKPAYGQVITYLVLTYNQHVKIDVTDLVEGRDDLSICIYLESVNFVDEYVYIESREGAYSHEDYPQILWTYDEIFNPTPIIMLVIVAIGVFALVRMAQNKVREGPRTSFAFKPLSSARRKTPLREHGKPMKQRAFFCSQCGADVPHSNRKFCIKCGEKFDR